MVNPALNRRNLLALAGTAGLSLLIPGAANAATGLVSSGIEQPFTASRRALLVISLRGGNDGLNTVVPRCDSDYAALRPTIALRDAELLPLDGALALHPALRPLMPSWDAGQLRVLLGVGHGEPVMSHHRANALWDSAHGDASGSEGWIAAAIADHGGVPYGFALGDHGGSLRSSRLVTVPVTDRGSDTGFTITTDGAQDERVRPVSELIARARMLAPSHERFPATQVGARLADCARLIAAGVVAPAFAIEQDGYDTHYQQRGTHDRLLGELGEALAAFRAAMRSAGRWDDVLVMVHSEFGRSAAENGQGGTDHGGTGPVLLLGGCVAGGCIGRQPSVAEMLTHRETTSHAIGTVKKTIVDEWLARAPRRELQLLKTGI